MRASSMFSVARAFGLLFVASQTTFALQEPFKVQSSGLDLSSIPAGAEYTSINSRHHPNHHVRIKAHDGWCDSGRSYTGYIDAGYGKELFFYFFESRSQPEEDPVVMWINGGPGATSALGLFTEQGPCKIKEDPKTLNDTYNNPYAWNTKANMFFLDSPIGVGFSHADHGQIISTTEAAAVDVAAFIDIFFDTFKEYQGRAFHMSGESYGGRYLPVFAGAVFDQNARLVKEGRMPVNLKSVMIGNGGTSLFKLVESCSTFMCTKHIDLGRAVLDVGNCISMAEKVPKCHKNLQKYCLDTQDYTSCQMWTGYCMAMWESTAALAGVNWYNVNQTCTPEQRLDHDCMPELGYVEKYLDLPDVRALLQVDKNSPSFKVINKDVSIRFLAALDLSHQTYYYVANLLERGVKVLNYVGTLDASCDHIGQGMWMAEMPWTGQEGFVTAPTKDWMVDGEVAGSYKTSGDLSFVKVHRAGHLVPTDQPKNALAMFDEWIEVASK